MPAETKSAPLVRDQSLQGATFTCVSDKDRVEALDKAFDYRGDVTLTLTTGEVLEGFVSNRVAKAKPPYLEFWMKGQDTGKKIEYSQVAAVAFSGKDHADGKSWEAWVSKKESERKAEAEKIRAELEAQGHL
jgi:transcriptional antiterminator Rof (Rho-off)